MDGGRKNDGRQGKEDGGRETEDGRTRSAVPGRWTMVYGQSFVGGLK
jgi:hypothetical protein